MRTELSLPTDIDAEKIVLGTIMQDDEFYPEAAGALSVDDFSLEKHRLIFSRMKDLYARGEHIDRITVHAELLKFQQDNKVDGLSYLCSLDDDLPRMPHPDSYVRQVKRAALLRKIIYVAEELRSKAMMAEEEPDDLLAAMEKRLQSIHDSADNSLTGLMSTKQLIDKYGVSTLLSGRTHGGLKLPWKKLDQDLNGLRGGQMVVLMAATSRGKTSMGLQVATAAALQGWTPVIWTMEMGAQSLFRRLVNQISGAYPKMQMTLEEREAQSVAVAQLAERPVYFIDRSRKVSAFGTCLRRARAAGTRVMGIVDHLQLIRGGHQRRVEEVSGNSRDLKLLAMDLDCPLLVLSQVDRSSVKGDAARIGLHSAKESGDVENDADVVMWIEAGELSRDAPTAVKLHVGKQREGPAGFSNEMVYNPRTQTFTEA